MTGDQDQRGPEGPATVAIVDDEPDIVFVLERILNKNGFEVVGTASDGQSGVDLVTRHKPDIVLLDLAMPVMSGEEALSRFLVEAPTTMVAILSAQIDEEHAGELLDRGAFAAYVKGDLTRLPEQLREDLARFRSVLAGVDDVPAWTRKFERL